MLSMVDFNHFFKCVSTLGLQIKESTGRGDIPPGFTCLPKIRWLPTQRKLKSDKMEPDVQKRLTFDTLG